MELKIYTIIVSYNGIRWIDKCLKKLKKSNVKTIIIVVDNNSSDETTNYIKENYSEVILLEQADNKGFGLANNIGISYALKKNADYFFLLNQDAYVEENTIEELVRVSENNKNFGIVSPLHLNGKGTLLDESFLFYTSYTKAKDFISNMILSQNKKEIYELNMVNAAAWLLPKKTIEIIGGFDPMFFLYGEDDNYCQRVRYHKMKIGITPNCNILHDTDNNYTKIVKKGSEKYLTKFLNRIKVHYGNVNSDNYKKTHKFKRHLLKESLINIFKFNFIDAKVNYKKASLISSKEIKNSVKQNRIVKSNYIEVE